jgi:hypothetical protein
MPASEHPVIQAVGPALPYLITAALFAFLIAIGYQGWTRFRANSPLFIDSGWGPLARKYGLRLQNMPGDGLAIGLPMLEGQLRGVPIAAQLVPIGQVVEGYGPRYKTRVAATCRRRLPFRFGLTSRNALDAIGASGNEPSFPLGDPTFDAAFLLRGADANACRALLADPEIRATLMHLRKREPNLQIAHGEALIESFGADVKQLESMIDVASVAALALEHAAATQPSSGHQPPAQHASFHQWGPR